jgi:hypothetical protein
MLNFTKFRGMRFFLCRVMIMMVSIVFTTDCGLNHYRRLMQQPRKNMAHSSIINTLNHDKCRRVREMAEKSWDEHLYGHDRSVIEDEDQITRMLMSKESLASEADTSSQQLYISGQLIAGPGRPPLPQEMATDMPIPKRPPWIRGVTDKAALQRAEQVQAIE